jgi:hypothetical protein
VEELWTTKACLPSHNHLLHRLQTLLSLPRQVFVMSAAQISRAPAHLLYPCYLAFLLILVLLPLLPCFVKVANEEFLLSLVAQAVLMLRSRRRVVRNEDLAVFAPVLLV